MLPQDKLNLILRRRDEVSAKLSAGASGAEFGALSRELSELEPLCATIDAWRASQDDEAGALALERDLQLALLPK
ncbi:MAG: peptide chain release factor 1, partial [Hyphomicrobiales bacterium]|nr:peptide chain release factor 1 [Hyphomicrobiales bacterium]